MTAVNDQVNDSTSQHPFDPAQASHVYGFDVNGNLVTDTATIGVHSWLKTYTYSGNQMESESSWVFQG